MTLRQPVAAGGEARVKRARLRADRTSTHLSDQDVQKITAAACFALDRGLPFNRYVTINWSTAGVSDALDATSGMLKLMGDFVRSRGGIIAYAYIREAGHGKGDHVHILMHVPPDLGQELSRRHAGWLKLLGGRAKAKWIKTERIGRTLGQAMSPHTQADYVPNLIRTVRYHLKGASPETSRRLQLDRIEDQGLVRGKRSGVSENIGVAARRRAGIVEVDAPAALRRLTDGLPMLRATDQD